eukprot:9472707-Pyramimonas_sp.AAC.1
MVHRACVAHRAHRAHVTHGAHRAAAGFAVAMAEEGVTVPQLSCGGGPAFGKDSAPRLAPPLFLSSLLPPHPQPHYDYNIALASHGGTTLFRHTLDTHGSPIGMWGGGALKVSVGPPAYVRHVQCIVAWPHAVLHRRPRWGRPHAPATPSTTFRGT